MVRKFIHSFKTPFPGSKEAFQQLAATAVPEGIKFRRAERIIHFGKYLQSHSLPTLLTWSAIDQVLEEIPPDKKAAKDVRSCMLALGHMLANEGKIESRDVHLVRRRLAKRLADIPITIRPAIEAFAGWSLERKTTFRRVVEQTETVLAICRWSESLDLDSIFSLNSTHVDSYLLETYWELRCSCGGTASPKRNEEYGAAKCASCGSTGPFERTERRSAGTVRNTRAKLFVFFEWAQLNRLVTDNPVKTPPGKPKQQIQVYPAEVLPMTFEYIMNPNNDPTVALLLFLTTMYLFTNWELRNLSVPNTKTESGEINLAESFGLVAPDRPVCLGRHSSARAMRRITIPENAREWLKPLLDRFQHQRSVFLNGRESDYLFVAPGRINNNIPVSAAFLSRRVMTVTKEVLGLKIGLRMLKKTAAVFIADNEGPEVVKNLGVDEQQAMAYRSFPRQLIG